MSCCPLSNLRMKCESMPFFFLPNSLGLLTDPNLLLLLLESLQVEPDTWVVLSVSLILLLVPLLPLLHLLWAHSLHSIVVPYEFHGISPLTKMLVGGFHSSLVYHCWPLIIVWIKVNLPVIIIIVSRRWICIFHNERRGGTLLVPPHLVYFLSELICEQLLDKVCLFIF